MEDVAAAFVHPLAGRADAEALVGADGEVSRLENDLPVEALGDFLFEPFLMSVRLGKPRITVAKLVVCDVRVDACFHRHFHVLFGMKAAVCGKLCFLEGTIGTIGSGLYCLPFPLTPQNPTYIREVHSQMISDRSLCIPILLNSLGNFIVSFTFVVQYALCEYFIKFRSVGKSLALRYFRNIFMPFEMIGKAINKVIFAEEGLALNLIPDGVLANAPFHKLTIFFQRLRSCSAELSEYPICREAGLWRFFP